MRKTRIAIACQGGGSQCAFVAGALKSLFTHRIQDRFEIVGLSGTSGGALTAAVAWAALIEQGRDRSVSVQDRILALWRDLTAQTPLEIALDQYLTQSLRLVARGVVPQLATSPSALPFRLMTEAFSRMVSRPEFTDLRALLNKHLDFEAFPSLLHEDSPALLIGACDILDGTFKVFSSRLQAIKVEALLASAAIPTLFPAVWVDGHAYWDGIFSSNPPVVAFLQKAMMGQTPMPEEIWVIQVNPLEYGFVPESPNDIFDRRNHLAGNLSLQHELQMITLLNTLLQRGAITDQFRDKLGMDADTPLTVRFISMSDTLRRSLDYPSKLSRQPQHISRLLEDGELRANAFISEGFEGGTVIEA